MIHSIFSFILGLVCIVSILLTLGIVISLIFSFFEELIGFLSAWVLLIFISSFKLGSYILK